MAVEVPDYDIHIIIIHPSPATAADAIKLPHSLNGHSELWDNCCD